MLLFGRGGGGRPTRASWDFNESADDRNPSPGVHDRSVALLVSSSYSSAARRFGEMSIGLELGRVSSCVSSWAGRVAQPSRVSVMGASS